MDSLTDSELREILALPCRIAVVGLSPVSSRPSYGVTKYMIDQGYEIFGVRPGSPSEILGRPCVEKIADLKEHVQIIDVFRNPDAVESLVTEIEAWLKPFPESYRSVCLWLQEGVQNPAAEERAVGLGLKVVSNRCILKEHRRLY